MKMDRHNFFAYDNKQRRKELDPEAVLEAIGLTAGQTFVDVGCGQGYFTIPAARIVGPAGKVYAIDINEDFMRILRENLAKERLDNVTLAPGRGEDTVPCRQCADIVFFGQVLHDFGDPAQVLRNAREILKPGGRLVNVDWKKVEMEYGPPVQRRLDEAEASALIENAGFKGAAAQEAGPYHYMITAQVR